MDLRCTVSSVALSETPITPLRADTVCFTCSAAYVVKACLPSEMPAENIETFPSVFLGLTCLGRLILVISNELR